MTDPPADLNLGWSHLDRTWGAMAEANEAEPVAAHLADRGTPTEAVLVPVVKPTVEDLVGLAPIPRLA